MLKRTMVWVLVGLLVVVPMHSLASDQDDAGSGQDAGDTREEALDLPSTGSYEGELSTSRDVDWYRLGFETSQTRCVEVGATGDAVAGVLVEFPDAETPGILDQVADSTDAVVPLTGAEVSDVYVGIDPGLSLLNALGGPYTLEIATLSEDDIKGTGDAWTDGDVSGDASTARHAPSGCFGGSVIGSDTDTYLLDVEEGQHITLSASEFGTQGLQVTLLDPSGTAVATVGSDEVNVTTADVAGTWSVTTSTTSDSNTAVGYLLGLEITDGPEPRPCNPNC